MGLLRARRQPPPPSILQYLPSPVTAKYANEASRFWDLFYRRNETRFFKDRHYFAAEFPQLLTAGSVFEVGAAVRQGAAGRRPLPTQQRSTETTSAVSSRPGASALAV